MKKIIQYTDKYDRLFLWSDSELKDRGVYFLKLSWLDIADTLTLISKHNYKGKAIDIRKLEDLQDIITRILEKTDKSISPYLYRRTSTATKVIATEPLKLKK